FREKANPKSYQKRPPRRTAGPPVPGAAPGSREPAGTKPAARSSVSLWPSAAAAVRPQPAAARPAPTSDPGSSRPQTEEQDMLRNLMKGFAVVVAATMLAAAGQALANGYGKQKVVYHINYDDPKAQRGALTNIQSHIAAVGAENMDLKVVLHGNGLALLVTPDALEELPKFKHG